METQLDKLRLQVEGLKQLMQGSDAYDQKEFTSQFFGVLEGITDLFEEVISEL